MSKAVNIAKLTLAFVIIAGGFSIIIGTLMGGGSSRGYSEMKAINKDPRSIYVQAVLVELDANTTNPLSLPAPGAVLTESAFNNLLSEAGRVRGTDSARVRTPGLLVQHGESGTLSVEVGERVFHADVSPSVIDTKHGPVLRVAIQIKRIELDSSETLHKLDFATAYTAAPGNSVVLDLAGLGLPGARAVLALRTSLIDPTPTASN